MKDTIANRIAGFLAALAVADKTGIQTRRHTRLPAASVTAVDFTASRMKVFSLVRESGGWFE